MIQMPGMTEWIIILVIVLVVFGGGKLAGVGKSLGTAISEFKSAVKGEEEKKETPAPSEKPQE
ncbi:MAG TPA: twin-arginine translocase TatA/TatE family subunit [Candidatus Hydrogenedentes bacterium]|nr:twin-arginine translocase TatA/TatE family subunit [Candidatus Hydrogenedentota bacterium]